MFVRKKPLMEKIKNRPFDAVCNMCGAHFHTYADGRGGDVGKVTCPKCSCNSVLNMDRTSEEARARYQKICPFY